jgi:folate-binding protein YgfZ
MGPATTLSTSLATSPGTLLVSGVDARTFLQGQLSADIDALTPLRPLLASCNSAQGRVQAIAWAIERSDGIALVLPASIIEQTAARLRKYVLRSKVKFDTPAPLAAALLEPDAVPAAVSLSTDCAHFEHEGTSFVRLPGHQQILAITSQPMANAAAAADLRWRLANIRAGLPQVYPATHESFVAQMLNLDLLGGVSFEKGCYTGQEIIARTHFRGAIKRRMFRFSCACPAPLPGTRVVAGDQHAGEVVDAAPAGDSCELLAVISLAQKDQALELESNRGVPLTAQALPYAVT